MNTFFCRAFQCCFAVGARFLPWRTPEVFSGEGSLLRAADILRENGLLRPFVIASRRQCADEHFRALQEKLDEQDILLSIFSSVEPNPSVETVEKIAAEKCGIIKHGSHAVLFGQSEGVENVAREKCAQEDVALTITAQEKLERISSSLDGQEFKYRGRGPYHLRLLGEYQLLNALTVIDVCNALRSRGWDKLTDEAIDEGLSHAQWPGRLELLRRGPDFIVDGAHNPQCVDALMDSLAALYGDKKLIFLTGVLRDKDWQQMLRRALPLAKAFVVITPPSARALDENELAAWLNAQGVQAVPAKDTDDGVRRALAMADKDDAICSWGSLYFTGEVRRVLTEQ